MARNDMAAHDHDGAQDFDLDRELRRLTRALTASIRSQKQKNEVAREYEDHIRDAMQNYMLGGMTEAEAFSAACEDLGDIDEIAATLGDVHNVSRLPFDVLLTYAVQFKVWYALGFLICVPPLFLTEIFSIVDIIGILYLLSVVNALYRYVRALFKRVRAVIEMYFIAHRCGFHVSVNGSAIGSLFVKSKVPAMILENATHCYKVRFVAAIRKNISIQFIGRNLYTETKQYGNALFSFHAMSAGWVAFRPKFIKPIHRGYMILDKAETPRDAKALPFFECRNDPKDKEVRELVLFNPVPVRIGYVDGNRSMDVYGGEEIDDVLLHDLSSFRAMMNRMHQTNMVGKEQIT